MKLKFLYTGCLLLCLSTIASSNESLRHCHHTAGKVVIPGAIPGVTASSSEQEQLDAPAPTLIKLLYI